LKKIKNIRCRLFITTLQPLGLAFFNSINKLLTIWYFESFPTSFYLLFFSCMLYNFKWFEFFSACNQLSLKNNSKELQPFWTVFHTDMTLWSAAARIFAGAKNGTLSLQTLISCNLQGRNFWNFFHIFLDQCTTRSYSYICQKKFFSKIWYLY